MKILVTGGAGFIGTNLIKELLANGHNVVSIDNYFTGNKENHQDGCLYYKYDLSYNYIRDDGDGYDTIYHLAALARIQPSLKDPYKSIYNNFVSTLNVLEYARTKNIRFVYAGSSSFHHGLYESPYAWSKFSGEDLCKLYSSVYGIDTAICRFYNVYGQYQLEKGTYATVMGIFENQFRNKEPLTIVGTGEQRRDFTHVDDIVDGLIKCSKQPFRGEIFELGSGVNYSINEITDMFGKDYPKKYISMRSGEYDVTLADYTLANKVLNWIPTKNIKTYIEKIV
ncbi:MAG: ADP-L-glycero-D-manno-heptose-6-epimerase [Flammeovirgaceae bacterium]|jgi:UDP-glucose 4-epimerase|nr:ADP-L-glycero-D-manno-heptose-6-epimerase [Flammeovirgaceae bacterium]